MKISTLPPQIHHFYNLIISIAHFHIILIINISTITFKTMDKLEQIKQKYGYTSKNTPSQSSNPINNRITNSIDKNSFSSNHKSNNTSQFQPTNGLYYVDTNTPKISCFDTFNQAQNKKKPKDSAQMYVSFGNNYKKPLAQIQNENKSNKIMDSGMIKNYENTYDLLTNYRKRIRGSIQDNKQSKIKPIQIQNKQNLTMDKQNKANYRRQHSSATRNGEENSLKSQPRRCSPLQGIDISNFVNVHHEIDNISKLQSRIYELLKEKNH